MDGNDGETGAERRGTARLRVSVPATVRCADGQAFPCVLRDMSPGGAKLSLSRRHPLPETFALYVPGRQPFPGRRRWQRGDAAGISLDLPAAPVTS